ncbi:unnamed protein product, partial [Ixodes pacificus]
MGPAGSCCYLAFIRPLLVGNWTSEVINDGVNYTDNYGALKCRRWCFRCPSCCFFGGNLSFVFCLGRRRLPFWEGRGVEKTEPCQVVCSGTRKQELGFIYNVRSIARGSVGLSVVFRCVCLSLAFGFAWGEEGSRRRSSDL